MKHSVLRPASPITSLFKKKSTAVDFFLNKEVIGEAGLKTECFTSSSKKNDYCKTQFAFKWTMYTGESFGQFSIALWGGTDKYAYLSVPPHNAIEN